MKNSNIEDNNIEFSEENICPSVGMFVDLITMDKPFGMIWMRDRQLEFLKKLGYKIIEVDNDLTEFPTQIAVKSDSDVIPNFDKSNIDEVFSYELQGILIDWLISLKQNK